MRTAEEAAERFLKLHGGIDIAKGESPLEAIAVAMKWDVLDPATTLTTLIEIAQEHEELPVYKVLRTNPSGEWVSDLTVNTSFDTAVDAYRTSRDRYRDASVQLWLGDQLLAETRR